MSGIVMREFSQLDTKNHERLRKREAEVTGCIGDVSESQEPNDRNNQVSKSCHYLGTVSGAHSIKFQQPLW